MKFNTAEGREREFEKAVEERAVGLRQVPGFRQIYLLRPAGFGEFRLVAWWDEIADHEAWVRTESYALSHSDRHPGIVVGPVMYEVATLVKEWGNARANAS
jgi:heme-degrading monooxygenase HmoA